MRTFPSLRLALLASVAGGALLNSASAFADPVTIRQGGVTAVETAGPGQLEIDDPRSNKAALPGGPTQFTPLNIDVADTSAPTFDGFFSGQTPGSATFRTFTPTSTVNGRVFGGSSVNTALDPGTPAPFTILGAQTFAVTTGINTIGVFTNTTSQAQDYQLHVHIADTQLNLATSRQSLVNNATIGGLVNAAVPNSPTAGAATIGGLVNAAVPNSPTAGANFSFVARNDGGTVIGGASAGAVVNNSALQSPSTTGGMKTGKITTAANGQASIDIPAQDFVIDLGVVAAGVQDFFSVEFDAALSGSSCTPIAQISSNSCLAAVSTGGFDEFEFFDTDSFSVTSTPVGDPGSSDVPEPATLGLLGIGLVGLAGRRRRYS